MRSNNRPRLADTPSLPSLPKYKVGVSNARSRLRLIESVRMFDEQRVNIAGTVIAFAGIVPIREREASHTPRD